jgi:hypothetical protein
MNSDFTQQKEQAHGLIERLAPEKLSALVGLLEVIVDSADSIDDEEETEEERQAVSASKEWFRTHPEGIPFEQVVADLGLTMDEVRNYKDPV